MMNDAKKQLLKQIYQNHSDADAWLDRVPNEISNAFFDNPYVVAMGRNEDMLTRYVFTEDEMGWVDWILWEWRHNKSLQFSVNDRELISTDDLDTLLDIVFAKS